MEKMEGMKDKVLMRKLPSQSWQEIKDGCKAILGRGGGTIELLSRARLTIKSASVRLLFLPPSHLQFMAWPNADRQRDRQTDWRDSPFPPQPDCWSGGVCCCPSLLGQTLSWQSLLCKHSHWSHTDGLHQLTSDLLGFQMLNKQAGGQTDRRAKEAGRAMGKGSLQPHGHPWSMPGRGKALAQTPRSRWTPGPCCLEEERWNRGCEFLDPHFSSE